MDSQIPFQTQPSDSKVLLFLAANPKDTTLLDLNDEFVELTSKLQDTSYQVKIDKALTINGLQEALLKYHPSIIHFKGHGTGFTTGYGSLPSQTDDSIEGIFLKDENGNKKFVTAAALASLFRVCLEKFKIDVVVLNACHSTLQADGIINAGVKYVIALSTSVPDNTAIEFTEAFYSAFSKGSDVEFAFKMASSALQLEGIESGDNMPKLFKSQKI